MDSPTLPVQRNTRSSTHPVPSASRSTNPRNPAQVYLLGYNFLSLALWATILLRLLALLPFLPTLPSPQTPYIHSALSLFTRNTQTLALLEPLHATLGLVRAPVTTTAMQVASRILLVWGIVDAYPAVATASWAYTTMLLAWATAECIRYGFFAILLSGPGASQGGRPALLLHAVSWLRYNAFFVLYPVGITSECWLVWKTSLVTGNELVRWGLWIVLAVYVPGSYVLFGHMMAQRRRVRRGKGKQR